jgi:hypothetical protein
MQVASSIEQIESKYRSLASVLDCPTGIKITDAELALLNLKLDKCHGDWNYTVLPARKKLSHVISARSLTNIVAGAGSGYYGAMHAKEIVARYRAEPAVFQHRALLISVNRSATEASL